MQYINYPKVRTWFIANSGEIFSHGVVDSDQCMTTGHKFIQTFTDYDQYVSKCGEVGILITDKNQVEINGLDQKDVLINDKGLSKN